MSPWGTRKWTSTIGTRQFTTAFSLPNIVIKPDLITLLYGYRTLCTPLPSDSDSETPKYLCGLNSPRDTPKWTSAIGTRQFILAFSFPNIVIKPDLETLLYGYRPLYIFPCLRLMNTKVPVWTYESIGTRKWTSAIGTRQFTMKFRLSNIVIKPHLETLLYGYRPLCTPFPKTHQHQITCVDSWVHRVPENGHEPFGQGNSLWRPACPILWSNPIL